MAERKREGMTPPALGGSSLLVAFAVLALTVFALLSLSTVQADVRLADASAQAVSDYYAADCEAQEILARLRNGEAVEGVFNDLDPGMPYTPYYSVYRYTVPISDTQELQVEAGLGGSAPKWYHILRWQAVPTVEWEPDDTLDLWDGIE